MDDPNGAVEAPSAGLDLYWVQMFLSLLTNEFSP